MNDKKLLELAAKAAGFGDKFGVTWTETEYPRNSGCYGALWNYHGHMDTAELWNPLTDDGDAFRLAVKLNIAISFPIGNGKFSSVTAGQVGSSNVGCHEPFNPDPCAATRRAIVRAAAELGG